MKRIVKVWGLCWAPFFLAGGSDFAVEGLRVAIEESSG